MVKERKQGSYATTFEYDIIGNIKKVTDPFSLEINYTPDTLNRLHTVEVDGKTFVYEYYDYGMIKSITYPDTGKGTLQTTYTYDNINRMTTMTNKLGTKIISQFSYEYDNNGNITKITENGDVTEYEYDELNRLSAVKIPGVRTITYTYIEERYEYTSDSKAVRLVSIWEIKNGVEKLKKKTEYIYDCPYYDNAQRKSWNVQEERQYIYNEEEGHWNDYISTFFEYKDNNEARNGKFNELYMTRKYVTGVNNSYGEPIAARTGKAEDAGIIDELYEYDWFGNVIRKQDGKGNGIRYEYDKLNRLVKEYREVDGSEKRWIYTTSLNENSVTIEDENKN